MSKARFFDAFASRPRPPAAQLVRPAVGPEGDRVRDLLAAKTPAELSAADIGTELEGSLWMLTPEAFRYFLPAFLHAALESYATASVFASELVGALTEPAREDVVEALDRAAQGPPGSGLPPEVNEQLRKQQLEWVDSGTPLAMFHQRFDSLTPGEGAAVLAFFDAFQKAHGAAFPFRELETAVERHWGRYRAG